MVYNIDMSTYSDREIEEALKGTEYCSLCGDSNFMCECDKHNSDDYDVMDDVDDY